jgi:tetratricopeptide (TPR) repeat protein
MKDLRTPPSVVRAVLLSALFCAPALAASAPAPDTRIEEARQLYNHTNYAAAAEKLQNANDSDSLRLLGQARYMLTDYKRAVEALDRAVSLDPRNSDNFLWLGRSYGRRAEIAFPLAAPALAVKARINLEKALELNPQNWDAVDDLFDYYLEAPAFLGGGADKAARMADLEAAHDAAQSDFDRARLAEQRKQFNEAEQHLRRAAQLAPQQVSRMVHLAAFLARRGRFDESDRMFEKAFAAAPNKPSIFYSRAHSLIDSNRNLPEARELLKKYLAMSLTPDDPSRQDAEKLLRKVSGS